MSCSKFLFTPLWSHCHVQHRSGFCLLLTSESTSVCLSGKDRHRYDSTPYVTFCSSSLLKPPFCFQPLDQQPVASPSGLLSGWLSPVISQHSPKQGVIVGNQKLLWEILMGKKRRNRSNIRRSINEIKYE